MSDIILDACMQYENYPIKTVGEEAFYSYYILNHYFKISKIRQKFKNSPIVKKSTSQVCDIILDACINFESYPTKTVGGDRFWNKTVQGQWLRHIMRHVSDVSYFYWDYI